MTLLHDLVLMMEATDCKKEQKERGRRKLILISSAKKGEKYSEHGYTLYKART